MAKAPAKDVKPPDATAGQLGRFLKLIRYDVDERLVREWIGAGVVRTLAEVGHHFGVEATTLRSGWRLQGMPGDPGRFVLADIFVWRWRHEGEIAARQKTPKQEAKSNLEQRLLQADVDKAEADARRKQIEVEELEGRMIDREAAGTAFRSILAELAEGATTIGDDLETEFPIDTAKDTAAKINRSFQRLLTAAAERGARVIPPLRQGGDS